VRIDSYQIFSITLCNLSTSSQMGHAGKQAIQEGSDDNDVPLAQRKRKVGTSAQRPRSRGRTNPPVAPHRSTSQGHRARTKQAHESDDHYDDCDDISLASLAQFVLRPSRPPRPATQMGVQAKVLRCSSISKGV
jgi:hypothetical protein